MRINKKPFFKFFDRKKCYFRKFFPKGPAFSEKVQSFFEFSRIVFSISWYSFSFKGKRMKAKEPEFQ